MPTLTSSMQSIEQLLLLQTFSRRAQLLREAKEREHLLLPGFADALKTLKLQRKRAQDTMLSTVKRYQLKQIGKIFRRWHEAARASKRAVEMLSTWVTRLACHLDATNLQSLVPCSSDSQAPSRD